MQKDINMSLLEFEAVIVNANMPKGGQQQQQQQQQGHGQATDAPDLADMTSFPAVDS